MLSLSPGVGISGVPSSPGTFSRLVSDDPGVANGILGYAGDCIWTARGDWAIVVVHVDAAADAMLAVVVVGGSSDCVHAPGVAGGPGVAGPSVTVKNEGVGGGTGVEGFCQEE